MADEIEFEEPLVRACECCGRPITSLTRFVYRDDCAFAVYYLNLTHSEDEPVAYGLVGLGNWGDDDVEPEQARVSFAFRLWLEAESYNLSIIDPDESPWSTNYLGRRLKRDEALQHPLVKEVFDLSDHITRCDEPLIAHLAQRS